MDYMERLDFYYSEIDRSELTKYFELGHEYSHKQVINAILDVFPKKGGNSFDGLDYICIEGSIYSREEFILRSIKENRTKLLEKLFPDASGFSRENWIAVVESPIKVPDKLALELSYCHIFVPAANLYRYEHRGTIIPLLEL